MKWAMINMIFKKVKLFITYQTYLNRVVVKLAWLKYFGAECDIQRISENFIPSYSTTYACVEQIFNV